MVGPERDRIQTNFLRCGRWRTIFGSQFRSGWTKRGTATGTILRKILGYLSEYCILILVGLILIVGPTNLGSRDVWAQCWLHIGAAALLGFWLIRLWCLAEPTFVWTSVTAPLLAIVAYALAWYLCSAVKMPSRLELLMLGSYAAIFLAVVNNLQRRWQLHTLIWIIVIVASAEAVDALLRYHRNELNEVCRFFFLDCAPRAGFQNLTRTGGTFRTPDHYAAYLVMAVGVIAGHVLFLKRSWLPKVFLLYLGGVILVGMALSKSRGGWVTLLAVVPFFVLLVLRGRFLDFRATIVGFILLAGVCYFLYSRYGHVQERMEELIEQGEATRERMYLTALKIAKDHPVFGVGPQMYDWHFWKYTYNQSGPQFVHNEYLQVLADTGVVGVLLYGWLFVMFFRAAFRLARADGGESTPYFSSGIGQRFALVMGGTAAVFAMCVHSGVDFILHVMGLGVTFTVIAATIFGATALRRKHSETDLEEFAFHRVHRALVLTPTVLRVVTCVLAAACVGMMWLGANTLRSQLHASKGYNLAHRAEPLIDEAIAEYQQAIRYDARNYTAALWLGGAYWAKTLGNWDYFPEEVDQSLRWHDHAVKVNPYFGDAYLNRANIHMMINQTEKALADCQTLVKLSPENPVYRFTMGQVYLALSDFDSAREQLSLAMSLSEKSGHPVGHQAFPLLEKIYDAPRMPMED